MLLWQLNIVGFFFKKVLIMVWLCQHWPLEFLNGGGEKTPLFDFIFIYFLLNSKWQSCWIYAALNDHSASFVFFMTFVNERMNDPILLSEAEMYVSLKHDDY